MDPHLGARMPPGPALGTRDSMRDPPPRTVTTIPVPKSPRVVSCGQMWVVSPKASP